MRAGRRFSAPVQVLAGAVLILGSGTQCADLVGISEVPGGDSGVVLPGLDGDIFPHIDVFVPRYDGSFPKFDATFPGFDSNLPGVDSTLPGKDTGKPGVDSSQPGVDASAALTYQPSNIGAMKFDAAVTGPLTLTGDNCVVYTAFPDPPGLSCDSGMNPPDDVFSAELPDGAGTATIWVFTYISIDSQSTLSVQGPNPLILVALGSVDIAGTIDASADRYDSDSPTVPGERTTGSGIGGFNNGGPQGGGGGSFCGSGGHGALGTGATAADSLPGTPYGTANLIPLWGGSPGGGANAGGADGFANGQGGGVVQISAAMNITVEASAVINVNGSGAIPQGDESGEGGGSGGAILLEAPTVTMAGTLLANGGEGSDNNMDGATPPLDGGVATEPGCVGGNGGAGTIVNGSNGGPTGGGYGGGGGGVGWIRINATHVSVTGTVSPSVGSACASTGPLP